MPGRDRTPWWSAERRAEFEAFKEAVRRHLDRNGLEPEEAFARLQASFPEGRADDVDPDLLPHSQLIRWFEHGTWDPVVLYAFCDRFSYNLLDAATALRMLPEDPSVWLGERMRVGTLLSVERYLDDKYRIRRDAARDARHDPVTRTMRQVEGLLGQSEVRQSLGGYGYRVTEEVHRRGRSSKLPFHTYLIFEPVPPEHGTNDSMSGLERGLALRREVDHELEKLRHARVYTHWEHARELTSGSADCQALIVESYFDNKPHRIDADAERHEWAAVTPVVLLGVYYSGVKDVAVRVAELTKLGALDVSRYIAEEIRDTRPFRRELILQSQVFWNLITSELGRRLIITIDDFEALAPRPDDPDRSSLGWPAQHRDMRQRLRPQKYPGTAIVLELDADLLDYAAYRIVKARIRGRVEEPRGEELRMLVAKERDELAEAQQRLHRLADRFEHRHRLAPLTGSDVEVTLKNVLRGTSDDDGFGYEDQVHEMFDAYMDAARTIADELVHRKALGPRGRRPR